DELLPQTIGVLARKLPGKRVQVAHAFHRDEKSLVGRESRIDETVDLLAEVVFQLGDVDRVDRLSPADVISPLVDLLFERAWGAGVGHGSSGVGRKRAR